MIKLNPCISLVTGNIFFSKMQTITVTVNCVGIMGKGIALQAKYLIPDAFKYYQKSCKNNECQIGTPLIYDEKTNFLKTSNNKFKKIILFPTKQHWKMNSEIIGIDQGLEWLVKNYKKNKIKSIALPALGCGNGGLKWTDVGPLMYKHLKKINIPIEIYLPSKNIPENQKTVKFLETLPPKISDY